MKKKYHKNLSGIYNLQILIFVCTLTVISLAQISLNDMKHIRESVIAGFNHELEMNANLLRFNTRMIEEQVEALSSRTMIRQELAKLHYGIITLDEICDFTQSKYTDGASIYENIIQSKRYDSQNNLIATYNPSGANINIDTARRTYFDNSGKCTLFIINNPIVEGEEIIGRDSAVFRFCDWSETSYTYMKNPLIADTPINNTNASSYTSSFPIGTTEAFLIAELDKSIIEQELKRTSGVLIRQSLFILAAIILITYFTIFRQVRHLLKTVEDLNEQAIIQERYAAIGQISAGVAHDFNNLLTGILGYSEILQSSDELPPSLLTYLEKIHNSGQKAKNLIIQLMDYGRKNITFFETLNIQNCLEDLLRDFAAGSSMKINLESDLPGAPLVSLDPNQISQAFGNIIQNSSEAGSSLLKITLSKVFLPESPQVECFICGKPITGEKYCIGFKDNGSGIDVAISLKKVFEPFFTTKEMSLHSGLGLSQLLGIISQNKGYLTVENAPGEGFQIQLYFSPLDSDE